MLFYKNKNNFFRVPHKKIIFYTLLSFSFIINTTQAFLFWLKSSDNTVENIETIEKAYNLYLPLVWFIYDPREQQDVIWNLKEMEEKLWNQRIYHVTISPNQYSAKDVADWKFDEQYTAFFNTIKELNLKVIFRTMHEMNGWRYPRSSNPNDFKNARNHVWNLSRNLWLTKNDILFDFSLNHRDMPTLETPSQNAQLIECITPLTGKNNDILNYEKECYRFEDYYPWDKYVDIIWVTFYNRWKATSDRKRKTPEETLSNTNWNTIRRMKKFNKPLFIDEVGTTGVRYQWKFDQEISRAIYNTTWADERKNKWLKQLSQYLTNNQFIWAVYFNVDYTYGLQYPSLWETDRAIINPSLNKFYDGFRDLYSSSKVDLKNILDLFWIATVKINGKDCYAPKEAIKNITFIEPIVNDYFSWNKKKISDFYKKLLEKPSWQKKFDDAIFSLAREYTKEETIN